MQEHIHIPDIKDFQPYVRPPILSLPPRQPSQLKLNRSYYALNALTYLGICQLSGMDRKKMPRTMDGYKMSLKRSSDYCRTMAAVGYTIKDSLLSCYNYKIGCGRWECSYCGKMKRKRLYKKIRRHWGNSRMRFLTLTVSTAAIPQYLAYKEISHKWDIFLKRLRRQYPGVKFFKCLEFTKDGYPHLHVLLNRFIPQPWISEVWAELFESPIVYIKEIGTIEGIGYVAAYATKWQRDSQASASSYFLNRLRRYSFSSNFLVPDKPDEKQIFWVGVNGKTSDWYYSRLCSEFLDSYKFTGVTAEGDNMFFNIRGDPDDCN